MKIYEIYWFGIQIWIPGISAKADFLKIISENVLKVMVILLKSEKWLSVESVIGPCKVNT